jgi:hypothetical protein
MYFFSRFMIAILVVLVGTLIGFGKLASKDFRAYREKRRSANK